MPCWNLTAKLLFLLFDITAISNGHKILFIPGHRVPSHTKSMLPLARALHNAGHVVGFLQIVGAAEEKVNIEPMQDFTLNVTAEKQARSFFQRIWIADMRSPKEYLEPWRRAALACNKALLEYEESKSSIVDMVKKWDLLVIDNLFAPCGMVASSLTGVDWIDFSTTVMMADMFRRNGLEMPLSVIPGFKVKHNEFDHRSFNHRVSNAVDGLQFSLLKAALFFLFPYWIEQSAREGRIVSFRSKPVYTFSSVPTYLTFLEPSTISFVPLDYPCLNPPKLDELYKTFIEDKSSKGTILIAAGHSVRWELAPRLFLQSFTDELKNLSDYRIVWQYAGNQTAVEMPHVLARKWIPQVSILQHPKTVAFLTHCGYKSLREAICADIPVIALPFFGDQFRNAAMVRKLSIGVHVDKADVQKSALRSRCYEVIRNRKYKANVAKLNALLNDKIIDDNWKANFLINFFFRHRKQNRCFALAATSLSYVQLYCLDMFLIFLASIVAASGILF
ncbi:UDP-glucoronosyl and UDP-glucosyl transferase [Trichuris suis]|nr:UDP-glucoronosyl and UDP-glucosyl transferase [Trichuris suis]